MSVLRKTWILVAGWALVLLGVAALILPGPGLLLLFAGVALLAREYTWAERWVAPVRTRAIDTAEQSVRTPGRIAISMLGGLGIVATGVLWGLDPAIPTVGPFGPRLPLSGWSLGTSLILSGVIVLVLLAISVKRFGPSARRSDVGPRAGVGT